MGTTTYGLNVFAPEHIADPFPAYEEIRAAGRVVWNDFLHVWMVPGYEDVLTMLRDPARFSNSVGGPRDDDFPDLLRGAALMITVDPPEQTRLRKVVQAAFLRGSLKRMEDSLAPIVDEVLDSEEFLRVARDGGQIDIGVEFCRVLPGTVIARLMGVPSDDVGVFVQWADDMSAVAGPGREHAPDWAEVKANAIASGDAFFDFMGEQIERHRREPHDDLINDLLVANGNGILTDAEMLAACFFLLSAGNETTYRLIGATLMLLAGAPEHRALLVADPEVLPSAIEEVMRYEGVNHSLARRVTQDMTYADTDLAAGDVVMLMTAAANRDPSAFEDADRFVPTRSPNPHVGFGHGVHHCLGAALARMEARTAIGHFLDHIPHYEVVRHTYGPGLLTRGPESLVIATHGRNH